MGKNMAEPSSNDLHILNLVDYHNEGLRNPTEKVKFPLSKEDKQIIRDMKYSIQPEQLHKAGAPWDAAVGMAANQWGINKQIFLYCPEGDTVNGLEVIINPSYEPIEETTSEMETEWEGCFSVPLAAGNIKRHQHIRVTYQNEAGDTLIRELSGWYARVWQHENDHLMGYLYDDPRTKKCLLKKEFDSREGVDEFYDKLREERKEKYLRE